MHGKNNVVLDSDVLINYSKEELDLNNYEKVFISVITYMEIFGYNFESGKEEKLLKDIVKKIEVININDFIIDKVIEIRKKIKIKLPDAIVFATSSFLNADLISFNEEDFKKLI